MIMAIKKYGYNDIIYIESMNEYEVTDLQYSLDNNQLLFKPVPMKYRNKSPFLIWWVHQEYYNNTKNDINNR